MIQTDRPRDVHYLLGTITSHVLHALPLWKKLGGTFVVTSHSAKRQLESYHIPVVCVDNVPYVWRKIGRFPKKDRQYITFDSRFRRTLEYLEANASVVICYELFEFSGDTAPDTPPLVFLTHGNMLKNYLRMYPRRLEILNGYDRMAALGPFMKQEFIESGVKPSKLMDVGIARTDEIVALRGATTLTKPLRTAGLSTEKPIVGYLPTFWGDSSVETLGPKLLASIADRYQVIFRPHPQTPPSIIDRYANVLKEKPTSIFYLPEKGAEGPSLMDVYASSSVIIGDVSSVILEAVLLDKPLVFANPDSTDNIAPHSQIDDIRDYAPMITLDNVDEATRIIDDAIMAGIDHTIWNDARQRCFFQPDGGCVTAIASEVRLLEAHARIG